MRHAALAFVLLALHGACVASADELSAADAAYREGRAEEAERLYERLASSGSTVGRVYRNLAILYDDSHRGGAWTEKAEQMYRKAIALDPADANAHFRYGLHLHASGRGRDALPVLRTAIRIDSRHAASHYWLARLLASYNEAEPGECEKLYRRALEADPTHGDAWFFLGRLLGQEGRKAEALEVLKKGQALPSHTGQKSRDDFADEIETLSQN